MSTASESGVPKSISGGPRGLPDCRDGWDPKFMTTGLDGGLGGKEMMIGSDGVRDSFRSCVPGESGRSFCSGSSGSASCSACTAVPSPSFRSSGWPVGLGVFACQALNHWSKAYSGGLELVVAWVIADSQGFVSGIDSIVLCC